MNSHWMSFVFGFFLFPLIYAFVPAVIGMKIRKKKLPVVITPLIPMTDKLRMEICKSLKVTEDLGWVNVMIQRIFFDSIRNYYLEHKIRENIMKSFSSSIGEGLLKKVRIKNLSFGAEAPYLKRIKLITMEEYEEIIRFEEKNEFQREFYIDFEKAKIQNVEIDNSNGIVESEIEENTSERGIEKGGNKFPNREEMKEELVESRSGDFNFSTGTIGNDNFNDNNGNNGNTNINDNNGNTYIKGNTNINDNNGNTYIKGNTNINDNINGTNTHINGNTNINDNTHIKGNVSVNDNTNTYTSINNSKIHDHKFNDDKINPNLRSSESLNNLNSDDLNFSPSNPNSSDVDKLFSKEIQSILIENFSDFIHKNPSDSISDYCDTFRNATFTGYFEYSGNIQMMIEVELPKGIAISLVVTLKKIFSNFIFRVPALNSCTRCELTLINNPLIEIDIDSGIINNLKKLYFQGSISRFIKKLALNSFKSTFVYPEWFQFIQPNTSSINFPDFKPILITPRNLDESFDSVDQILLFISSDFKLLNYKSEIITKKSYCLLNDKNHVFGWSFKISRNINKATDYKSFEGVSSLESKVLSILQAPEIIKKVFPTVKDVITVCEMKNISILKFVFDIHEQEYIKVIYKNNVIFYKNCTRSEFIVFKTQDEFLNIFNYSDKTVDLFFNNRRVEKLKKILDQGDIKIDRRIEEESNSDDSNNKAQSFENMFKEALRVDNADFKKFTCELKMPRNVLEDLIKDSPTRLKLFEENGKLIGSVNETKNIKMMILEYKSGLDQLRELRVFSIKEKDFTIDICPERNLTFIYKVIELDANRKSKKKVCKNKDSDRKLKERGGLSGKVIVEGEPNENTVEVISSHNGTLYKNENISRIIKNTSQTSNENSSGTIKNTNDAINENSNGNIKNKILNCNKNYKANVENSNGNIKNKVLSNHKDTKKCILEILYKSTYPVIFPNYFIECIKIKESFQKYFQESSQMSYSKSPNELVLETYVNTGSIYFEFRCDKEDDYSLEIFSCKKQLVVFQIYKIITVKEFKCIYPIENDFIRMTLYPKHRRNSEIEYKFKNFSFEKNILVDGVIGLDFKEKVKIKIDGSPSHVIFWDKNSLLPTRAYIQDSYGKTDVQDSGILRADLKEYVFAIKNKAEKQRNIRIYVGMIDLK